MFSFITTSTNFDVKFNWQVQQNENFFFYDTSLKFLYDINNNSKLRVNAITIFNHLDYNVVADNLTAPITDSELSQQSIAGNISFEQNWSNTTSMAGQLSYSNYRLIGNNGGIDVCL